MIKGEANSSVREGPYETTRFCTHILHGGRGCWRNRKRNHSKLKHDQLLTKRSKNHDGMILLNKKLWYCPNKRWSNQFGLIMEGKWETVETVSEKRLDELMLVGARRFVKSVCTGVILLDDVKVEGVDIVLCDVDDVARLAAFRASCRASSRFARYSVYLAFRTASASFCCWIQFPIYIKLMAAPLRNDG
ncbi:hypothetical protein RIR_jg15219.t1 [Rhizophagus irregularis DAOM 181602=DAOM 197198]|nr:hypothetical protein RIR_jg15219.t1 [Rhizophagus irregularis DAOM 181602=DAOM 197198]